jgi:ribosomal protein S18 acetylase RimI-like enzyme
MKAYKTIVTHLELTAPFPIFASPLTFDRPFSYTLERNMALADYRQLYDNVGRAWRWVNRRKLTDRMLAALIHHPDIDIFVLRDGNRPIGYVELNFRKKNQAEIVFVGLVEDYIGRGLGPQMLDHAMHHIQTRAPQRVIIQTCTLDHPAALLLYQSVGFTPYDRKKVVIYDDV